MVIPVIDPYLEFRAVLPWELVYVDNLVVRGFGSTSCKKSVQEKRSGIKGRMSKVMVTYLYRLQIGASANLELVDKFCYLGDMLSMDGDADAAVEANSN